MKYCGQCGCEYVNTSESCADCGAQDWVSAEALHERGIFSPQEVDTRSFVTAGVAEDFLSMQQWCRLLEEAAIPVLAQPGRLGAVDALTSATPTPFWDLRVPELQWAHAQRILREAEDAFEAAAAENALAAEEEACAAPRP